MSSVIVTKANFVDIVTVLSTLRSDFSVKWSTTAKTWAVSCVEYTPSGGSYTGYGEKKDADMVVALQAVVDDLLKGFTGPITTAKRAMERHEMKRDNLLNLLGGTLQEASTASEDDDEDFKQTDKLLSSIKTGADT